MSDDAASLPPTWALPVALERHAPTARLDLPDRYRDLGLLGSGGMGEVRRVWDRALRRPLAMKLLRADAAGLPDAVARFFTEARLTAGLQHPGIVPVHDQGLLAGGRPWLTMREVRGRTFADVLASPPTDVAGLRRVVGWLAAACDAVAHAHGRGVVHRDLKPQNLMIDEREQVLVLDWGLAARTADDEPGTTPPDEPDEPPPADPPGLQGSPGYVAPEGLGCPDPRLDVYALGVVLHELLAGQRPIRGEASANLYTCPTALSAACRRALSAAPTDRFRDAGALAEGLRAWLESVRRLEDAEALLAQADMLAPTIEAHRAAEARLRAEAADHLAGVPAHAPETEKRPAWDLEDRAAEEARRATERELEWERTLRSALKLVPDLAAPKRALAAHYRRAWDDARDAGREQEALRLEALVRAHDSGEHRAWCRGDAELSLAVEPAGARVRVLRYVREGRRLVPVVVGDERAPLVGRVLPEGSYLLEISAPGFAPLRYPVRLSRGGTWDTRPPGADASAAVRLFAADAIGVDEVVVSGGWFTAGGDPEATDALARTRVWVDTFAIARHPVTNAAFVAFLDDLVARGRNADAERWAPREQGQREGDAPMFGRDADGRFLLAPRPGARGWPPDWPVTMVSWDAARAYAAWAGERHGVPLRLPHELEWEKAARGVDARFFPWGDHGDPTWARMVDSLPDYAGRAVVAEHELDESPYGVRGLGGNVRDWCHDAYRRGGPPIVDGRPLPVEGDGHRIMRGGCWASPARMCRSAARFASLPDTRLTVTGFRLARSL